MSYVFALLVDSRMVPKKKEGFILQHPLLVVPLSVHGKISQCVLQASLGAMPWGSHSSLHQSRVVSKLEDTLCCS